MSKNYYDRSYEAKLMDKIIESGIDHETIVQEFLSYFSSDETCAALESICDDYDIDYDEED